MPVNARYGYSPGPYKLIPGDKLEVNLERCGVHLSKSPTKMADGESPDADKVRFGLGGVSSEFGIALLGSRYAGGADKTIIGISEFQRKDLTVVLVRHRPTEWDRWNGSAWVTLGGTALVGLYSDRLYSVVMQDRLVVANKVDKLQAWDGIDGHNRADLSADAPKAWYIAPFGNRLVAARINTGSAVDPYKVQWSTDGDITDWTTAVDGAGSVILEPEGKTGAPEFIKGMSALETALVLYRDRSIVLGTRTGVGAMPFRWATVVFGLGTDAPYSIANAGATVGDFFLGSDLNVYLFDARTAPVPIGDPIHEWLRANAADANICSGTVDRKYGEYCLFVPPTTMWVFSIKEYLRDGKLCWRKRTLATGYTTLSYGQVTSGINPVVDSVTSIVDLTPERVDEYGVLTAPTALLFGDNNGGVSKLDNTSFIAGKYVTRQLGDSAKESRLDRLFMSYSAAAISTVSLEISTDGGLTWGAAVPLTLQPTQYTQSVGITVGQVVGLWMARIQILSGNVTIYGFDTERYGAGRVSTG